MLGKGKKKREKKKIFNKADIIMILFTLHYLLWPELIALTSLSKNVNGRIITDSALKRLSRC